METVFTSINDTLKKARNPFFGTLIFIWTVSNWQLFVIFFGDFKTADKIHQLSNFFSKEYTLDNLFSTFWINTFYGNIFWCIVFTFLSMKITYKFLLSARKMAENAEKNTRSEIGKINAEKIKLTTEYDALQNKLTKVESSLNNERDSRYKLEDEINKKIKNLQNWKLILMCLIKKLSKLKKQGML